MVGYCDFLLNECIILATAALNSDGKIAVVVLNLQDRQTFLRVWLRGKFVKYQCPPNATITFILQPI